MDPVQPEASVVQVGLGVRYVGQYVYAYSGLVANVGGAVYDGLSFTTGSGIIVGKLNVFGWLDDVTDGQGKQCLTTVKLNGTRLILMKTDGSAESMPSTASEDIIIPPFTLVEVTFTAFEADSNTYAGVTLTGRVYGVK